jgi:hypothetical protein
MAQAVSFIAPVLVSNLGNTVQSLLAGPGSGGYILTAVTFCNKTAAAMQVNCSIYNGTTDVYIANNQTIAPYDTLSFGGEQLKMFLTSGLTLRAFASAASGMDATVHAMQFS